MGVFRLGFLIDFVSGPVSAGFTSAVSLIIFTSQFKDLLGVNTKGDTFVGMWTSIINDIHNISWNDAGLGVACIVVLLSMRAMASISFGPKDGHKTCCQKFWSGLFWVIGTSRNAVLVIVTSAIGYYLISSEIDIFRMVGYVPSGMPEFKMPPFTMTTVLNTTTGETIEVHESFAQMVSSLGSGLIVVPLIALLENMAVVQAFGMYKFVIRINLKILKRIIFILKLMANPVMPHKNSSLWVFVMLPIHLLKVSVVTVALPAVLY